MMMRVVYYSTLKSWTLSVGRNMKLKNFKDTMIFQVTVAQTCHGSDVLAYLGMVALVDRANFQSSWTKAKDATFSV